MAPLPAAARRAAAQVLRIAADAPLLLTSAAPTLPSAVVSSRAANLAPTIVGRPLLRPSKGILGSNAAAPPLPSAVVSSRAANLAPTIVGRQLLRPSKGILGSNAAAPPLPSAIVSSRAANLAPTIVGRQLLRPATRNFRINAASSPAYSTKASLPDRVKHELKIMEETSAASYEKTAKKFSTFRTSVRRDHAMLQVARADATISNARVGWRVVYGSIFAGLLGIGYILNTKSNWAQEYKHCLLESLSEFVYKLQSDAEKELKRIVREEMDKRCKD